MPSKGSRDLPGSPAFGASSSSSAHPPGPAAMGYMYEPRHASGSCSCQLTLCSWRLPTFDRGDSDLVTNHNDPTDRAPSPYPPNLNSSNPAHPFFPPSRDPLQRALTEVPDYSVASRVFLGGVPPLSSMRGLPSYEEAGGGGRGGLRHGTGLTRENHHPDQEQAQPGGANANASPGATATGPSLSRSEPDIAGRFARVRILEPLSPRAQAQAQAQTLASASSAGPSQSRGDEEDGEQDDEEDEGIQMRPPRCRAI